MGTRHYYNVAEAHLVHPGSHVVARLVVNVSEHRHQYTEGTIALLWDNSGPGNGGWVHGQL